MNYLIIVRHSQSQPQPGTSAHQWELTAEGKTRCKILASVLRPYDVNRVITSEEPKAHLTGELVAQELHISVETAPNLHETKRETVPYFHDLADFRAAVQQAMKQPEMLLFGEVTFTEARERFSQQISSLLAQYPHETLAVVTHGTIMSLYLAPIIGRGEYELWQSWDMPAYAVLRLPERELVELMTTVT